MQFQSTMSKIHPCNFIHTVSEQAIFKAMPLCTLLVSLEKNFRQRHVLVLSTLYHTHPGCTQTPIEIHFQSTLSNIHPCNSIYSVSVKAVFNVLTLCTLLMCLKK